MGFLLNQCRKTYNYLKMKFNLEKLQPDRLSGPVTICEGYQILPLSAGR